MFKKKINIVVAGATGFTGLDLVYLLTRHPNVNLSYLCATKNIGKNINFFDKRIRKNLPSITNLKKVKWKDVDLVFLSLPNGEAQKIIKTLFNKHLHLKFIDLSADFRIRNLNEYKKTYGISHKAKDLIKKSIYSISEFIGTDIKKYRIVANPGCYPTSVQIPLIPLLNKKLINNKNIVIDSKSGFSGAGKNFKKKFTHKNLLRSTYAYGIKNHRHILEIDQELFKYTKQMIEFSFNPHLLPTFRGILSTIYVDLKKNVSIKKIIQELKRFYKNKKFIKILKINSEVGSGSVLNTNSCEISVCQTRIKNKIVIFSAIDNLVKGASGQAIQNMNLMYNFSETSGLK